MGAWIETLSRGRDCVNGMSHPMWVRGLKHNHKIYFYIKQLVASYVGAWIETESLYISGVPKRVASYVGAWIETNENCFLIVKNKSHPMWVRGLKLSIFTLIIIINRSHPMWVRGLKLAFRGMLIILKSRILCGCVD